MARKQTEGLQEVGIRGAASRVDTFVYGPRAEKTNTALELADALKEGVNALSKWQEQDYKLDVAAATENKLYGGSLYTAAEPEALADYDTVKNQLGSMEAAEQYYMERMAPKGITDPHQLSGYQEKMMQGLGKFRGQHATYLAELKQETRSRDVFNDFFSNVDFAFSQGAMAVTKDGAPTPKAAFDRLAQIADNFGIDKKGTNTIPIGVAEVLVAQGKFDQAQAILNYKRGPAGSLLSNPETALEAQKIMSKIDTENSVGIANAIKSFEDMNAAGTPYNAVQKAQLDKLLDDKNITIEKRNSLLLKNEEAVRIDNTSKTLGANVRNGTFFGPIAGLTTEEADKARDKYTKDYYNKLEDMAASGAIDNTNYSARLVAFAEQTNSTNTALKNKLSQGYSAVNPAKVVETGEVSPATIQGIQQYAAINQQNPNVAANHVDEKTRKFYDDILLDVRFGGYTGDSPEAIVTQAVQNYARDTLNPIKTSSNVTVSDADIITALESASKTGMGGFLGIGEGSIQNSSEWIGAIRKQVQDAARRTGSLNQADMLEHLAKQVVSRNLRVGDYLVPAGTLSRVTDGKVAGMSINDLNTRITEDFVRRNPDDGYEADDLVIVPITGAPNKWGVAVKGMNNILEVFDQNQMSPTGGVSQNPEAQQILRDEGVKKNKAGQHISYRDSEGHLTGGHGHLMTEEEKKLYPEGTPIPDDVVESWKATDMREAEEDVSAIFGDVDNPEVKNVLTNMAFNLGRTNLNEFTRLKKAIKEKDYKLAAQSMRESKWYKQVGGRADRLIERIEAQAT